MNEIYGGAAVTPMLVPDWNQTNPNRADYIKNKPDVAGAIKCSASGNPIRLEDVSPLEHALKVSVDVGGATVKKHGINLLPNKYDSFVNGKTDKITQYGVTYTCNADGSITLNGTCEAVNGIVLNKTFPFANDVTYCISGGSTSKGASIYVSYKNESGTTVYAYTGKTVSWKEGCSLVGSGVYIQVSAGVVLDNYVIKPQIEVGATKTEYQQYKEPTTYTADENGNVNGIIGNGEDMTLIADNGATITAEYNADTKKYIDKKFAELQALVLEV